MKYSDNFTDNDFITLEEYKEKFGKDYINTNAEIAVYCNSLYKINKGYHGGVFNDIKNIGKLYLPKQEICDLISEKSRIKFREEYKEKQKAKQLENQK